MPISTHTNVPRKGSTRVMPSKTRAVNPNDVFVFFCFFLSVPFGSSFGSCWGGVHQFVYPWTTSFGTWKASRGLSLWLNTYLVGRLPALPPENDSHLRCRGSHGSVAMQGPNRVTSQQKAAIAPLPDRIDALNSSLDPWERTGAAPQGWATHLRRQWCRSRAISN